MNTLRAVTVSDQIQFWIWFCNGNVNSSNNNINNNNNNIVLSHNKMSCQRWKPATQISAALQMCLSVDRKDFGYIFLGHLKLETETVQSVYSFISLHCFPAPKRIMFIVHCSCSRFWSMSISLFVNWPIAEEHEIGKLAVSWQPRNSHQVLDEQFGHHICRWRFCILECILVTRILLWLLWIMQPLCVLGNFLSKSFPIAVLELDMITVYQLHQVSQLQCGQVVHCSRLQTQ